MLFRSFCFRFDTPGRRVLGGEQYRLRRVTGRRPRTNPFFIGVGWGV